MKECITHHHACDCREAEFAKLTAENEKLKRIVDVLEKSNDFYASGNSWRRSKFQEVAGKIIEDDLTNIEGRLLLYGGKTARQAKEEVERIRKGDGK